MNGQGDGAAGAAGAGLPTLNLGKAGVGSKVPPLSGAGGASSGDNTWASASKPSHMPPTNMSSKTGAEAPQTARNVPRKLALPKKQMTDAPLTERSSRQPRSSIKSGGNPTPKKSSMAAGSALTSPKATSSAKGGSDRPSRGSSKGAVGSTTVAPTPLQPPRPGEGHITPATALKNFASHLTDYEQGEILEYKQVYFLGNTSKKVQASTRAPNNCGFDDERGDYSIVMHDHIAYRFEILSTLGKGSFGQVVKCLDYKTNQLVAVKIIRNKKRFHHQALVEVKILSHLKSHDPKDSTNIVRIKDSFYFRHHLCITFSLLSINLYEFIKNNNFQGVSLGLIRRFAIQILTALRFLRKQQIVHCDLKPENILLKQPNKSGIKVIDYGSSCFADERVYTYIQSRFYRSPEVILGLNYAMPIDMWSFGTILAELFTGYPLFPGENEVEQLLCIMEVLDVPPKHMLDSAPRKKIFFDSSNHPRIVPNSRGKKRRPGAKDLRTVLRCNDPLFIDFLTKCLDWDPDVRMTPDEALKHDWIMEATIPVSALRLPRHRSSESHSSHSGSSSHGRRHKRRSHHHSHHHHGYGTHHHSSHHSSQYHSGSQHHSGAQIGGGMGGMSGVHPPVSNSLAHHYSHNSGGGASGGGGGASGGGYSKGGWSGSHHKAEKASVFPPISIDHGKGSHGLALPSFGAGHSGGGYAGLGAGSGGGAGAHASHLSSHAHDSSGLGHGAHMHVHAPATGSSGGSQHRRHRSHQVRQAHGSHANHGHHGLGGGFALGPVAGHAAHGSDAAAGSGGGYGGLGAAAGVHGPYLSIGGVGAGSSGGGRGHVQPYNLGVGGYGIYNKRVSDKHGGDMLGAPAPLSSRHMYGK